MNITSCPITYYGQKYDKVYVSRQTLVYNIYCFFFFLYLNVFLHLFSVSYDIHGLLFPFLKNTFYFFYSPIVYIHYSHPLRNHNRTVQTKQTSRRKEKKTRLLFLLLMQVFLASSIPALTFFSYCLSSLLHVPAIYYLFGQLSFGYSQSDIPII